MKKILVLFIFLIAPLFLFAQSQQNPYPTISPDSSVNYRLFPTRNMWTFIKLNTKNGQLWQVQWDTGRDQLEVPLSLSPRVPIEKESIGRFFLYPTQNMYNFLLIDQIDGRVWQVQWSTEVDERVVVPIF